MLSVFWLNECHWVAGGCCPVLKQGFLARLVYGGSVPPLNVALKLAKNSDAAVILLVRVPSLAAFSGLVFGAGPCCAFIDICTLARHLQRFFCPLVFALLCLSPLVL